MLSKKKKKKKMALFENVTIIGKLLRYFKE